MIQHIARPIVSDRGVLQMLLAVCVGRIALVSFGNKTWFIGHCVLYIAIASPLVLRTAAVLLPPPGSADQRRRAVMQQISSKVRGTSWDSTKKLGSAI